MAQIMTAQFKAFWKDPAPNLLAYMDETDVRKWYFMVFGLHEPKDAKSKACFAGGEYLFLLTAPDEFPQCPPKFEFLTPNGVFTPGGSICISVGEYHANDAPTKGHGEYGWRPSLGMGGFALQVVNALINYEDLGSGIRIEESPKVETIVARAGASASYNLSNHRELVEAFELLVATMAVDTEAGFNFNNGRRVQCGLPLLQRAPATPAPATPATPATPAFAAPATPPTLPAPVAPPVPAPATPLTPVAPASSATRRTPAIPTKASAAAKAVPTTAAPAAKAPKPQPVPAKLPGAIAKPGAAAKPGTPSGKDTRPESRAAETSQLPTMPAAAVHDTDMDNYLGDLLGEAA